jgi:hypothetical protein
VIFAAQQQQQQQQVKAQGPFDQGYAQGTDDAKSNNERNNTCPSDLDHGACFLFQQGYNLGYTDEKFLHGNDRPRTQDDGEFQDNN